MHAFAIRIPINAFLRFSLHSELCIHSRSLTKTEPLRKAGKGCPPGISGVAQILKSVIRTQCRARYAWIADRA